MTMIETVKRVLGQSDRELVVECRHCGSTGTLARSRARCVTPPKSHSTTSLGDETV